MTSQKLNEEHEILRRFMAVVVSSAFKNSLIQHFSYSMSIWAKQKFTGSVHIFFSFRKFGMQFFCLQLEASCLQLSFLLTVMFGSFLLTI